MDSLWNKTRAADAINSINWGPESSNKSSNLYIKKCNVKNLRARDFFFFYNNNRTGRDPSRKQETRKHRKGCTTTTRNKINIINAQRRERLVQPHRTHKCDTSI